MKRIFLIETFYRDKYVCKAGKMHSNMNDYHQFAGKNG